MGGHFKKFCYPFNFCPAKTHNLTLLNIVCYTFERIFTRFNNPTNWNLTAARILYEINCYLVNCKKSFITIDSFKFVSFRFSYNISYFTWVLYISSITYGDKKVNIYFYFWDDKNMSQTKKRAVRDRP